MSSPILVPELEQMVETISNSLGINPRLYLQHVIVREWVAHRRTQLQTPMACQLPPDPELEPYQPYNYEEAVTALELAQIRVDAFSEEG